MSWVVIATPLEGADDFEVIGTFPDRETAVVWTHEAFFMPDYENYLFRVKQLRAAAQTAGPESDALEPTVLPPGDINHKEP
jgi:hypothetical protein